MAGLDRCPELVERDDELRLLSTLASQAAEDAQQVLVVVTGEAGLGKSRLCREFVASLPESWSRLFVRVPRSGPAWPAFPDERPFSLVVDDAHHLDPGVFEALSDLLEVAAGPALVLLTFRLGHHPAGSTELRSLAALLRHRHAHEIRLTPLSPAGVEAMASAMGRYPPADLYGRAGGNPFWAEELLRGGGRTPWTLVEAVSGHLGELAPPGRELATALAVAEEPVGTGVLSRLLDELDEGYRSLSAGGWVHEEGGALGLRHALVGEALLSVMGPAERRSWHARLAAALQAEEGDAALLARHWSAAGRPDVAAPLAGAAARHLDAEGSTRRAYEMYRLAAERPPVEALPAAELFEAAALCAARLAEFEAAHRWSAAAQQRFREAGEPHRAVRLVMDPVFDFAPGIRGTKRPADDPVESLLVDAHRALAGGDAETARRVLAVAELAARRRQDGIALCRIARQVVFGLGELDRGDRLAEEAARCPDVRDRPRERVRLLATRARFRYVAGHPLEALELARDAAAIGRADAEALTWTGLSAFGHMQLLMGEIDAGATAIREAVRSVPLAVPLTDVVDGWCRLERGDLGGGLEAVQRGSDAAMAAFVSDPLGAALTASTLLAVRAVCEAHAGDTGAALATVARLDAACPEPFGVASADAAYVLARAGAAEGHDGAIENALIRVTQLGRVASGPAVAATIDAVRGYAARSAGRTDEALRRFQAAAGSFERAARGVLAAEMWCEVAADGVGAAAAAAIDRARQLCSRYGLGRVAMRVASLEERHARAHGAPDPLIALTPRERDVVVLVAEGLSNRQVADRLYLSDGTVRNYLSSAFAKLGVSRRSALVRLVAVGSVTR